MKEIDLENVSGSTRTQDLLVGDTEFDLGQVIAYLHSNDKDLILEHVYVDPSAAASDYEYTLEDTKKNLRVVDGDDGPEYEIAFSEIPTVADLQTLIDYLDITISR